MKIVTVADMIAMEQATAASGFGYDRMMAAAGAALAESVWELGLTRPVVFLIGPGNNGGDGLVACALLQQRGIVATPYVWKRSADDALLGGVSDSVWADADAGFDQLRALVARSDVVVDAVLGTGNARALAGSLADLLAVVRAEIERLSQLRPARFDPTRPEPSRRPLVVACDCPSGLFCDTGEIDPAALPADITVTFALPKVGHLLQPGTGHCGRLVIADIGIDRSLAPAAAPDLLTGDEAARLLPARPASAHKGTFGRALIVAGSHNYPGAAALACTAAYRAGAGLVRLASPTSTGRAVASQMPEPVHTVLSSDMGALTADAAPILSTLFPEHNALLIGPGLGAERTTVEFITALFFGQNRERAALGFHTQPASERVTRAATPPLVLDADGLNCLARSGNSPARLPPLSILTPHPGEMARLADVPVAEINRRRWEIARTYAAAWRQIVVLKGAYTVIAHPDGRLAISPFADAALATAGSGDVLAGAIVGLLAQGLDAWTAARAGVYLHALAGRLAAASGPTPLASDIARQLTAALARLHSP